MSDVHIHPSEQLEHNLVIVILCHMSQVIVS